MLSTSRIILFAAVALGFFITVPAQAKILLVPLLAILMMFSIKNFVFTKLTRHELFLSAKLLGVHFGLLSGVFIILYFVFRDPALLLLAVTPPAVNIIPLTVQLRGNLRESVVAASTGLLSAVILFPFIGQFFQGYSASVTGQIAQIIAWVIVVPFILGLLLHRLEKKYNWNMSFDKYVIMIGNGLIFFLLISMNKAAVFAKLSSGSASTLALFAFLTIVTFFLSFILVVTLHDRRDEKVDLVLFASFKNVALAGIVATAVGLEMSLIAFQSLLFVFQAVFVEYILEKKQKAKQL